MTSRRHLLLAGGGLVAALGLPKAALADATKVAELPAHQPAHKGSKFMTTATMKDGAKIYFKDWGIGPVVTFSHGWPLTADAWDAQMLFLANHGYRVIAHDRRSHGRSDQTWTGNDMDTYADDLATLRHGTSCVSKAVLISAVPPHMAQTPTNPNSAPMSVFDGLRSSLLADRAGFFKELSMPFFGYNRPNAKVSQGQIDSFWLQGMMGSLQGEYDCIKAFSETDFTDDLRKMTIPTLLLQGNDDQIVPIDIASRRSVKILPNASLKEYAGAPHGMCVTHADQVNADLLAFLKE